MARTDFENLEVYRRSEKRRDIVRETAADSAGANIAEGASRGAFQDKGRFVRIARGSLNETEQWLLVPEQVALRKPLLDELGPRNA